MPNFSSEFYTGGIFIGFTRWIEKPTEWLTIHKFKIRIPNFS
ncbi:hypothetical protein BVI2075_530042 [Burkholderia vietnamiensis]|nr:hypothetical protein BVI2075_530042 [Burkholderia vietnamiensis]